MLSGDPHVKGRHYHGLTAILFGLAVGWQWFAIKTLVATIFDPSSTITMMVCVLTLLGITLGSRLPARLALKIATRMREKNIRKRSISLSSPIRDYPLAQDLPPLQSVDEKDEPLLWIALAILASLAGTIALTSLFISYLSTFAHQYAMDHFFWTHLTLNLWEWLIGTLIVVPPSIMHGLVLVVLGTLTESGSIQHSKTQAHCGGMLYGLGLAAFVHNLFIAGNISATQEMLMGTLPMFGLSAFAALLSQPKENNRHLHAAPRIHEPEWHERTLNWIWLSLVAWGVISGMIVPGWLHCYSVMIRHPLTSLFALLTGSGTLVLMVAMGSSVARFHARHRDKSPSGCGMALWVAGVCTAGAVTIVAFLSWGPSMILPAMLLVALPLGYAMHYVEHAWLSRTSHDSLGWPRMLTAILAGTAIGLTLTQFVVMPAVGPLGTMATAALALMALGGLVQIYEDGTAAHIQYERLALVFGTLSVAILTLPSSVSKWDGRSTPQTPPISIDVLPSSPADLLNIRRICLIVAEPYTIGNGLAGFHGEIDSFVFDPLAHRHRAETLTASTSRSGEYSAFRAMSLISGRYDLIYQQGPPVDSDLAVEAYSSDWLSILRRQCSTGGQIIIEIPLNRINIETLQTIAASFHQTMIHQATWRLMNSPTHSFLRLRARPHQPSTTMTEIALQEMNNGTERPLEQLCTHVRPHSLNRPDLLHTLRIKPYDPLPRIIEWLARQ